MASSVQTLHDGARRLRGGVMAKREGSAILGGVAGLMLLVVSTPSLAGSCFEQIDCPDDHYISTGQLKQLSCDSLWTVRNSIFNDNGYCFKTAKAKATFDNSDCSVNTY